MIIDLVVTELLFEGAKVCLRVDHGQFKAGDFGEVFHVFGGDRVAEPGVMRATGINPRGAGGLEIRPALPDGAGDRKFRQRLSAA